jgi:hypothetical protein
MSLKEQQELVASEKARLGSPTDSAANDIGKTQAQLNDEQTARFASGTETEQDRAQFHAAFDKALGKTTNETPSDKWFAKVDSGADPAKTWDSMSLKEQQELVASEKARLGSPTDSAGADVFRDASVGAAGGAAFSEMMDGDSPDTEIKQSELNEHLHKPVELETLTDRRSIMQFASNLLHEAKSDGDPSVAALNLEFLVKHAKIAEGTESYWNQAITEISYN